MKVSPRPRRRRSPTLVTSCPLWPGRLRSMLRAVVVIAILVAVSHADRSGRLLARPPDVNRFHLAETVVVRVIDGDTLEVDLPDHLLETATTRVRLIGIDCPEPARGSEQRPAEPFADEATLFVRDLTLRRSVTLRLEPQGTRDRYRRLLAHVDLEDGSSLAETVLIAGLARAEQRWPHAMLDRYRQLELAARRRGAGMWER